MKRDVAASLSQLHRAVKQAAAAAWEASQASANAARTGAAAAARSASGSAAGFSGRGIGHAPTAAQNRSGTTPRLTALGSFQQRTLQDSGRPAAASASGTVRGYNSGPSSSALARGRPGAARLSSLRPLATAAVLPQPNCQAALQGGFGTPPLGDRSYASQPIGRITPEGFTEKAWEVRLYDMHHARSSHPACAEASVRRCCQPGTYVCAC